MASRIQQLTGSVSGQFGSTTAVVARLVGRVGLTLVGAGALLLAVLGWLLARSFGAITLYLMVYALAAVVAIAFVISRRKLSLTVERAKLPQRMQAGQRVPVELTVASRRRVTTIVLSEEIPPLLGAPVTVPIAVLKAGEALEHSYVISPSVRGIYKVGPLRASWSDPFGLTRHEQLLAEAQSVIVHPVVEQARDGVLTRMWEDPPVRPPVSKPWPVGFEFYGMRDYVPGDDLRRVVWKAYARTGRMLVRESEQGITDRVVIWLDNDAAQHSPGSLSETFETAVSAAAGVGVQHLIDGFSVTLMTNDGVVEEGLRGSTGRLPYLDHLARADRSTATLAAGGNTLLELGRNRPHVLVLTPYLRQQEASQLKLLVDRGISVVVGALLWEESDPMTTNRAAAVGAGVVQLPAGANLSAVFANRLSARR